MKKVLLLVLFLVACIGSAAADSRNYVKAEAFKGWLESGRPMILVDIQEPAAFAKQHFKGSLETNAYPVKSDEERKRLDKGVAAFKQSGSEVVVICPRGGGGAKNAYDYLKTQGVPEEKLIILENGIDKWPYKEMLEKTAGQH